MGIATFCLISLVGLLPIGLNVIKNSQEQSSGAACLNQLASDIRHAMPQGTGFRATGVFSNIAWTDQVQEFAMNDISMGGTRALLANDKRLAAYVKIEPSNGTSATGRAFISVAWPNRAGWDGARSTWTNAQGSVSTWVILLPSP